MLLIGSIKYSIFKYNDNRKVKIEEKKIRD